MPLASLPEVESSLLCGRRVEPWSTMLLARDGLRETAGAELPRFDTMAELA